MLFLDFSWAFIKITGQNPLMCNRMLNFLTGWPVSVGSTTSSIITLNMGAPQGYVPSSLLFTLMTHACTPLHNTKLFITFADDTAAVGLICNNDESNCRGEVSCLQASPPAGLACSPQRLQPSSLIVFTSSLCGKQNAVENTKETFSFLMTTLVRKRGPNTLLPLLFLLLVLLYKAARDNNDEPH